MFEICNYVVVIESTNFGFRFFDWVFYDSMFLLYRTFACFCTILNFPLSSYTDYTASLSNEVYIVMILLYQSPTNSSRRRGYLGASGCGSHSQWGGTMAAEPPGASMRFLYERLTLCGRKSIGNIFFCFLWSLVRFGDCHFDGVITQQIWEQICSSFERVARGTRTKQKRHGWHGAKRMNPCRKICKQHQNYLHIYNAL